MEKQAYLPIKFYPAREWQEYEKLKEYGGDYVIVQEYFTTPPAFQMVIGDIGRHWSADSFLLGTFELVNYDTGATHNLATVYNTPIVYRSDGGFRTLVFRRFPWSLNNEFPEARYYYHLVEDEGETEWFSEVFELCDFDLDAFDEVYTGGFNDNTGFASIASTYQNVWRGADCQFCKTAAAPAWAYMEFTAFLEEEFDLYVRTSDRTGTCGGTDKDWDHPAFFYLRTQDGVVISDLCRVDTTDTCYHFNLKAEAGGLIRLYFYILDADVTEGDMDVFLYRTHTENHIQLRWFNDTNSCKIVYDELPAVTPFQYENIYLFDAKQTIDENSINENVVEDDAANKYRIIGTKQKWNSLQMFGSECLLNALSLLRLHSNVKIIKETGEPMDVTEILLEQSVVDYHGALAKLVYREESCSEDNCGFEVCCPGDYYPTLITVEAVAGSLPAVATYAGRYAMVFTAARQGQIYLSSGAAWNIDTTFRVVGACVAVQNYYGDIFSSYTVRGMQWSFFHTANTTTNWYPVIEITTVVDATGGQATVNIRAEYWFGANVWCQVEYYTGTEWEVSLPFYIDEENWTPVVEKENLAAQTGIRALTATCGVGTFYFRVHIWDDTCDLGYCIPTQQTIT